jgi:hypothetical protein
MSHSLANFLCPIKEMEPNWVEDRVKISSGCTHVVITNTNAEIFIDPKGDKDILERLLFAMYGQKPYGEWLKRLTKNERAPRGKCGKYFIKNVHLKNNRQHRNE